MVVISHFDQDHISGLEVLLAHYPVRVLLLPAMSLSERLVIAFSEGLGVGGRYMRFLLDPVAYIASLSNVRVEHVVLVPPSSGRNFSEPVPLPEGQREVEPNLPGMTADLDEPPGTTTIEKTSGASVHRLKPGGRLVVNEQFEFVPYNDASVNPMVSKSFARKVDAERESLMSSSSSTAKRKVALSQLKAAYDKQFGRGSVSRNIISLFLYAGLTNTVDVCCHSAWQTSKQMKLWGFCSWASEMPAVLYTGDGYLDTPRRLTELTSYLGPRRIDRTGCLQVMHHGSRHSWHAGLAESISPLISVFSSDPAHRRFQHPHAEVVRDFLPFTPMQVDKKQSVTFWVNARIGLRESAGALEKSSSGGRE